MIWAFNGQLCLAWTSFWAKQESHFRTLLNARSRRLGHGLEADLLWLDTQPLQLAFLGCPSPSTDANRTGLLALLGAIGRYDQGSKHPSPSENTIFTIRYKSGPL